jgi:hypothetical protein
MWLAIKEGVMAPKQECCRLGTSKDFLCRTAAAQQLRKRVDKWDYMKLKSFCTTKEMVSKLKRPPTG